MNKKVDLKTLLKSKKILIGMPAFNESAVIYGVILNLKKKGFNNILVVDDCSEDNTFEVAQKAGASVLRHIINRGAGGATATIIEHARRENYDYLILMDSDGQHSVLDAEKLLRTSMNKRIDLVVGSRIKGDLQKMPLQRKIANHIGSFATWFVFGKYVLDSQSGFRVLSQNAIQKIDISYDKFEFCSEMIGECYNHNLSIREVPIKVIYSDHSMNKGHGQNIGNGFTMLERFLFK
jgi:glycosyltransferase involved in cell wall biosynthesis